MKQSLYAYLFSLLLLLAGSLIFSGLLSALYYYHVLTTKTYEIINIVLGIVLFLIAGFVLGKKTTKKALIHAFLFVVPFLALSGIIQFGHLIPFLIAAAKGLVFTIGTIIGVNLSDGH